MRIALALTLTVAVGGLLATQVFAAAEGKTKICGQKKGPFASWSATIPGLNKTYRFKGSTWTVFATDVKCSFAMASAPGLLRQWSKAKISARLTLKGWLCTKEKGRGYSGKGTSSGSIGCAGPKGAFIAIYMYAPYTLAQIKQVAATGTLPG